MIRMTLRRRRAGETDAANSASLQKISSPDETDEVAETEAGAAEACQSVDDAELSTAEPKLRPAGGRWQRIVVYGLLPAITVLMAGGVSYLKWLQTSALERQSARIGSVQAATESTIKILSYTPESVDHDLDAARDRLTGTFRDAYTQLTHEVVIPGSKEKKISAVATVPAATSISANPSHAVVMVFVNQSIMVGNDPPSSSASTVRVTMDKHDNRWLISDFTPI